MSENWPKMVAQGWHPVAELRQLGSKPYATRLMGVPLVLFMADGAPALLVDRCPHRSVPLSGGKVCDGVIACPYHGWRFRADGECIEIPGAVEPIAAHAKALPIILRLGLVWTSLADNPPPFPLLPSEPEDKALDHFTWNVAASKMRLLDAIENMLDASHPHFVHPWFLRTAAKRRPVEVDIHIHPGGAEAVYHEDAQAAGFMPRLLEGKRTVAIGRYFAPTIGQLIFRTERGLTVSLTAIFTPEDVNLTRPFAWFSTERRLAPAWLKKLVLKEFNRPLLKQDQRVLADQVRVVDAMGGDVQFKVGPLDMLGPAIWKIANGAEVAEVRERRTVYL